MKWTLLVLFACVGCTPSPAKQGAWPQSAGSDAPIWPAASTFNTPAPPLTEAHPEPVQSIAPAGNSSLPAVLPADASATLDPVAPRRLLILFTAPKCKPCEAAKRLIAAAEPEIYGNFSYREVDVTTNDCGTTSAPWLALFDGETQELIAEPLTPPKTLDGLQELLDRWGTP
jgi:hypothetical protein